MKIDDNFFDVDKNYEDSQNGNNGVTHECCQLI